MIKEGKIKRDKHESVIYRRDNSHYESWFELKFALMMKFLLKYRKHGSGVD